MAQPWARLLQKGGSTALSEDQSPLQLGGKAAAEEG